MAHEESTGTRVDAVVTIDIQRDYFPGGRFPLWRPGRALRLTRLVLDAARKAGIPVLHVRHESLRDDARFFRPGEPGAELHPGLGVPGDGSEAVILKHAPDAFLRTDLRERLDAIGAVRVMWMGMMSWMCVDTTVRAAAALGYDNLLVEDACAAGWLLKDGLPVFPWTSHRAFMAALGQRHAKLVRAEAATALLKP